MFEIQQLTSMQGAALVHAPSAHRHASHVFLPTASLLPLVTHSCAALCAGCCKTTLARAAAGATAATFLPLSGAQLHSMYVGEGEATLRRAFARARLAAPAIMFIDELDSVAGVC